MSFLGFRCKYVSDIDLYAMYWLLLLDPRLPESDSCCTTRPLVKLNKIDQIDKEKKENNPWWLNKKS